MPLPQIPCTWKESIHAVPCDKPSTNELLDQEEDTWACLCDDHYKVYEIAVKRVQNRQTTNTLSNLVRVWMKAQGGIIQTHRRTFGTPQEFRESFKRYLEQSKKKS